MFRSRISLLMMALGLGAGCQTPEDPPAGASGRTIYRLQLCRNCHGEAGEGRSNGPPLRGLAKHWTRADLADFLGDTEGWEERDERLAGLSEEYSGDMRAYANLTAAERTRLAEYLLGL